MSKFMTFLVIGGLAMAIGCSKVEKGEGTVVKILDGRSVQLEDGSILRMAGLETPECGYLCPTKVTKEGLSVMKYLEEKLLQKKVSYTFKSGHYEEVGFIPVQLFVDSTHLNLEMLRIGYARYLKRFGKAGQFDQEFNNAQEEAKRHNSGFWNNRQWENSYIVSPHPTVLQNKIVGTPDKLFHKPDCPNLVGVMTLIRFETTEEAEQSSFRPCPRCFPGEDPTENE